MLRRFNTLVSVQRKIPDAYNKIAKVIWPDLGVSQVDGSPPPEMPLTWPVRHNAGDIHPFSGVELTSETTISELTPNVCTFADMVVAATEERMGPQLTDQRALLTMALFALKNSSEIFFKDPSLAVMRNDAIHSIENFFQKPTPLPMSEVVKDQ